MGCRVERGKRGKVAAVSGGGDDALPAAPRIKSGARYPSRKREGSKVGREGLKNANPFMPGLRLREDGWTVARTRTFLALLAQTGCVADAARVAGVSTTSVNRSRKLFAPFDRACAEALANALRGLEAVAYQRAVEGRETVVIREGREVERRIVRSDAMLALLLKRGDLSGALGRALSPAEAEAFVLPETVRHRFIDRAEYESGIVFQDGVKQKHHVATQEETDAVLIERIEMLQHYHRYRRLDHPPCATCGQMVPLTEEELAELDRAEAAGELAEFLPPAG